MIATYIASIISKEIIKITEKNILYHCSNLQDLTFLDPDYNTSKPVGMENNGIYATDLPQIASAFSFKWNDSMGLRFGRIDKGPWILEIPKRYLSLLKQPCSMYFLDKKKFKLINHSSMGNEFICYEKVKILKEIKFKSCLQCMKKYKLKIKILKDVYYPFDV